MDVYVDRARHRLTVEQKRALNELLQIFVCEGHISASLGQVALAEETRTIY